MKKVIRLTESDLVRLVEKVISEQVNDCSRLIRMKSGMNPDKGAFARGYKPEDTSWTEKLEKVVSHTHLYEFLGHPADALRTLSKCKPSKKSLDFIVFKKGKENLVYIGVD